MPKFLSFSAAVMLAVVPTLATADDQAAPADKPARSSTATPRGLMRYDTNKDGAVDHAEWKTAQEARFKQLDANSDDKLAQDELFARTPATGNSVLPTDRQVQRQSSYFQLLDADKDGVVTLVEFMAQGERNFTRCDVNKDGRTDTAECRQALQRNRADR